MMKSNHPNSLKKSPHPQAIINIFYPDASGNYRKMQSMDVDSVTGVQQQVEIGDCPQSLGGFFPDYSFQQMGNHPDPYRQHNNLLQYRPTSCD
jgi:hypothetical protein